MHRLADLVSDGFVARCDLVDAASASTVERWLRKGDLAHLQPGIVALPDRAVDRRVRARAAAPRAGGPLSHLSALAALGLVATDEGHVHVTVPVARFPRGGGGVVVHRSDRRLVTVRCGSLEASAPERSLVDAWTWAHSPSRNRRAAAEKPVVRRALIEAVRSRHVRPAAVLRASEQLGGHPGRRSLERLLGLLAGGCESELEIWGVQQVLPGPPRVPPYVQQHRVVLPDGRRFTLDAAWPALRVAVELDGAAFHGSREARERDLRRDSALAAAGWIVLRFSYARS